MIQKLLIFSLLILVLIAPASALITNNTANQNYYDYGVKLISGSFLHDQSYLEFDVVQMILYLGIIFWILSIFAPSCQDIFAILAPIFLATSSWFFAYTTRETLRTVVSNSVIFNVHSQIIEPQPLLQILAFLCTVSSILTGVYIIWMRDMDKRQKSKNEIDLTGE